MKKKVQGQRDFKNFDSSNRWVSAVLGTLGGYTIAEIFLMGKPHPWHWLTALLMGVVSFVGIALWQRQQYKH